MPIIVASCGIKAESPESYHGFAGCVTLYAGKICYNRMAAKHKLADVRIIDFHHASEHLDAVAKAVHGRDSSEAPVMWEYLRGLLYDGNVQQVITEITAESQRMGPPVTSDSPEHPRRVLQQNQGYFEKHKEHMRYDVYRKKGWSRRAGIRVTRNPASKGSISASREPTSSGTSRAWNVY